MKYAGPVKPYSVKEYLIAFKWGAVAGKLTVQRIKGERKLLPKSEMLIKLKSNRVLRKHSAKFPLPKL